MRKNPDNTENMTESLVTIVSTICETLLTLQDFHVLSVGRWALKVKRIYVSYVLKSLRKCG